MSDILTPEEIAEICARDRYIREIVNKINAKKNITNWKEEMSR